MSAQLSYNPASAKGVPGGIYDMYHYAVDSRFNEEENGVLRFGVGVVPGTVPGSNVALPTEDSVAADFEGVVINGFTNQHDLEGVVTVLKNQNIGVIRKGRVWVRLAEDAAPVYGGTVYMVTSGDDAGCFAAEEDDNTVAIPGRFIGGENNGIAPVELYGIDIPEAASAPEGNPGGNVG